MNRIIRQEHFASMDLPPVTEIAIGTWQPVFYRENQLFQNLLSLHTKEKS